MTVNACVREPAAQFGDKPNERSLLLLCASVLGGFAVGGAATDVANADRIGIMPQAVSTNFLNVSAHIDAAVEVNHKVITDALEATLLVPGINIGDREVLAFRCRRTMNDNL